MAKKPAQLSDSLLNHRPRKGNAKPQSEVQAVNTAPTKPVNAAKTKTAAKTRRRVRRSQNTEQLNLRISPETLDRFTNLADNENVIFGEMLVRLINKYKGDS